MDNVISPHARDLPRAAPRPFELEPLEPRLLLSSYVVDSPLDTVNPADGVTTLREAIQAANAAPGADAIEFEVGLSGTITLGGSQLEITDDLTVTGPGAGLLAIDANGASRVLHVGVGVTASVSGLTPI